MLQQVLSDVPEYIPPSVWCVICFLSPTESPENSVDFAILRAGYGKFATQKEQFEANYKNAKAVGMPVGAYWYSYATSVDEAKQEAQFCRSRCRIELFYTKISRLSIKKTA